MSLRIPQLLVGAIPERGFLADYLAWCGDTIEAPIEYHYACGLICLACATQGRHTLRWQPRALKLNLFALLIGPSGSARKSSTLGFANRLLAQADVCGDLPTRVTPEAFIKRLQRQPAGLITHPELGDFLATLGREYMVGTAGLVAELYDCPPQIERETMKGSEVVREPFVCILGGTTPAWLYNPARRGDIEGGLLPRFMMVPASTQAEARPWPLETDRDLESRLARTLQNIANSRARALDDAPIRAEFEPWYLACWQDRVARENDLLATFLSRMETTTLKVAALLALAEDPDVKAVEPHHLKLAQHWHAFLRYHLPKMLQEISRSRLDRDAERVKGILLKHAEGLSRSDLRLLGRPMDGERIQAAVRYLQLENVVQEKRIERQRKFVLTEESRNGDTHDAHRGGGVVHREVRTSAGDDRPAGAAALPGDVGGVGRDLGAVPPAAGPGLGREAPPASAAAAEEEPDWPDPFAD